MFDFFKKKSSEPDPYYLLLDKLNTIEAEKPEEFDPYNELFISCMVGIYVRKVDAYRDFFKMFSEKDLSPDEWRSIQEGFELEKEGLDWALEIEHTMDDILFFAQEGVLQSDLKKKIPDANPQHITNICKRFEADGMIKREKRGSTYFITR